jgi:hypothetical protein
VTDIENNTEKSTLRKRLLKILRKVPPSRENEKCNDKEDEK